MTAASGRRDGARAVVPVEACPDCLGAGYVEMSFDPYLAMPCSCAEEPDPDRLREDRDERARLRKECPDVD